MKLRLGNPDASQRHGARLGTSGLYVILGCDGAGKTSVLRALTQNDGATFRSENVFHWLPRYRPDWQAAKPVPAPHAQKPRGTISSFLKVIYLLGMFHLGFWTEVRPRIKRGNAVLFDRYYHDMIIDPARYRYGGPIWLSKFAGAFIPKPRAWFLIDVPAEVLARRKAEIPITELRPLRDAYLSFVRTRPNGFVVDGTKRVSQVAAAIAEQVNGQSGAHMRSECVIRTRPEISSQERTS